MVRWHSSKLKSGLRRSIVVSLGCLGLALTASTTLSGHLRASAEEIGLVERYLPNQYQRLESSLCKAEKKYSESPQLYNCPQATVTYSPPDSGSDAPVELTILRPSSAPEQQLQKVHFRTARPFSWINAVRSARLNSDDIDDYVLSILNS
jgi:hypothetical protein